MKTASAKAKARRLQNMVAEAVQEAFGLPEPDVRTATMGEPGADLKLSSAARAVFPFAVECKNTERLSIWKALRQAREHAGDTDLMPLLVFKRNRSDVFVGLRLEDLLEILKR